MTLEDDWKSFRRAVAGITTLRNLIPKLDGVYARMAPRRQRALEAWNCRSMELEERRQRQQERTQQRLERKICQALDRKIARLLQRWRRWHSKDSEQKSRLAAKEAAKQRRQLQASLERERRNKDKEKRRQELALRAARQERWRQMNQPNITMEEILATKKR